MTKLRRYTKKNGINILVSWIQKKCRKCGKFLPSIAHNQEYCSPECRKKDYKERFRHYHTEYMRMYK
jgi:predicted nucleic acid-binding Zn ribbon protein